MIDKKENKHGGLNQQKLKFRSNQHSMIGAIWKIEKLYLRSYFLIHILILFNSSPILDRNNTLHCNGMAWLYYFVSYIEGYHAGSV